MRDMREERLELQRLIDMHGELMDEEVTAWSYRGVLFRCEPRVGDPLPRGVVDPDDRTGCWDERMLREVWRLGR